MKMKNYEKYLDGILLITWSPSYIGNTSLTVILLFALICGVTGIRGWLASWKPLPMLQLHSRRFYIFHCRCVFWGSRRWRMFKIFKSLKAEIKKLLWQSTKSGCFKFHNGTNSSTQFWREKSSLLTVFGTIIDYMHIK